METTIVKMETTVVKFHVVETAEAAQLAAMSAAANCAGAVFPVILFQQGSRQAMSGALPVAFVRDRLKRKSAEKRGNVSDAMDAVNRPLDLDHAKAVGKYIAENVAKSYILPPLTLNIQEVVDVWTINVESTMKPAYLCVPMTAQLAITDGQHRQVGLQFAASNLGAEDLKKLDKDSVCVMITCESEVKQIHQDFADCSKTKALPQSQLAVYDRRNPANGIVLDLADNCPLFSGKIDATSATLSKKSISLFLTNQIRQMVKELLVNSYAESDATFESKAHKLLGVGGSPAYNKARDQFVEYVNEVTNAIPVLKKIAALNPDLERNQIPLYREAGWICLTATGLNVIGRIGHELIVNKNPDWKLYVARLGEIDWRKTGPLWQGNIVKDGKMMTQQSPLKAAIKQVREAIGLAQVIEPQVQQDLVAV